MPQRERERDPYHIYIHIHIYIFYIHICNHIRHTCAWSVLVPRICPGRPKGTPDTSASHSSGE